MCVKPFTPPRTEAEPIGPIPGGPPTPPLIYVVTAILPPPQPPPGYHFDSSLPPAYLALEGKGLFGFDCTFFRKLEPLPPDQVDLPEHAPEPVA